MNRHHAVSIPKRVSEVLWLKEERLESSKIAFQSLKGFQRFCGLGNHRYRWLDLVSIPKRVSEVLWLLFEYAKSFL